MLVTVNNSCSRGDRHDIITYTDQPAKLQNKYGI